MQQVDKQAVRSKRSEGTWRCLLAGGGLDLLHARLHSQHVSMIVKSYFIDTPTQRDESSTSIFQTTGGSRCSGELQVLAKWSNNTCIWVRASALVHTAKLNVQAVRCPCCITSLSMKLTVLHNPGDTIATISFHQVDL
eukprot:1579786-Amphidinium_carterae.1